ncbi:MAG: hypothetical protein B6229_04660 [Spirochaetaceae bacterium 4572_7]|nr:MAG: hypothetical protein B6229_04660 [Spirochaetaceae bacterium 4572_7]
MKKNNLIICFVYVVLFLSCSTTSEVSQSVKEIESIVQAGHSSFIYDIDISPNGKFAATASNDGQVLLWRTSDGMLIRRLGMNSMNSYFTVDFSNDGSLLAAAGVQIKIYDIESGKEVKDIFFGYCTSINFSPDDKYLFITCQGTFSRPENQNDVSDSRYYKVNWKTWKGFDEYEDTDSGPNFREYGPAIIGHDLKSDGKAEALVFYKEGAIELIGSTRYKRTLDTPNDTVDCQYTSDGLLHLLTKNGSILTFENGKKVNEIDSNTTASKFYIDENDNVAHIMDRNSGKVSLIDRESGEIKKTYLFKNNYLNDFAISKDNNSIWLAGGDYSKSVLKSLNIEDSSILLDIKNSFHTVAAISKAENENSIRIAMRSNNNSFVRDFNFDTLQLTDNLYSSNDEIIWLESNNDGSSFYMDVDGRGILKEYTNSFFNQTKPNLSWAPITAMDDGSFTIITDSKIVKKVNIDGSLETILSIGDYDRVVVHPSGNYLIIIERDDDNDNNVDLYSYNIKTDKKVTIGKNIWDINNTVFHPKEYLYYFSNDDGLQVYDCNTGKIETRKGRGTNAQILDVNEDGTLLAGSSQINKEINIYDSKTLEVIHSFDFDHFAISNFFFTPDNKYLIASSQGPDIYIMSIKTGKILQLVILQDEWFITTKDGYFSGSTGIGDYLGLVQVLNGFGIDQLAAQFNRPDIIMEQLGIVNPELSKYYLEQYKTRLLRLGLLESDFKQELEIPRSKILNTKQNDRKFSIDLKFDSTDIDLKSYQIYINDVPQFKKEGKPLIGKTIEISELFILNEGKNKIEISCKNALGAESFRSQATAIFDKPTPGRLFYIGLGVSDYENPDLDLSYAHKDILDMEKAVQTTIAGYSNVFTKVYTDSEVIPSIIPEIKTFLEDTEPEDLVILFIAGHGVYSNEENPKYYFLTHNADLDDLPSTAVNFDSIESILMGIKARKKLFLLDTCESGEVIPEKRIDILQLSKSSNLVSRSIRGLSIAKSQGINIDVNDFDQNSSNEDVELLIQELSKDYNPRSYIREKDRYILNDLSRSSGAIVFSSCGAGEFSYERSDLENGIFTDVLLNCLKTESGADINNDKIISIRELITYVASIVPDVTSRLQNPSVDRDNIFMDFGFELSQ